jgi:Protease inhibitor Inh
MRVSLIAAGLASAGLLAGASLAATEDNEAGVPLTPAEAAGAWTVSSNGQDLCVPTLNADHGVKAPRTCSDALPGNPTSWQPTKDGMQLVGSDAQAAVAFHRWSNSLFVSHRSSGVDIQLRRGGRGG